MSVTMRLPDSRCRTALRGGPSATSIDSTASPKRNVTLRARIWWKSSSTISRSRNSSGRSRRSTSVTATPRAAKIEVYSMPMTPAPTTARVRGKLLQLHHVVGVQDDLAVGPDPRRVGRMGADGDQDVLGGDLPPAAVRTRIIERVGIDERGLAGQERHVVAAELVLDHLDLARDHDVDAGEELLAGGPRVEPGPRQPVSLAREAGEGDAPPRAGSCSGWCRCRCRRRPRHGASRRRPRAGRAWPPARRRAGPRGRCRCRPGRSRRSRS